MLLETLSFTPCDDYTSFFTYVIDDVLFFFFLANMEFWFSRANKFFSQIKLP